MIRVKHVLIRFFQTNMSPMHLKKVTNRSHRDSTNLPSLLYLASLLANIYHIHSHPFTSILTTCRLRDSPEPSAWLSWFFQATNDVALHLLLHHYFQEIHGAKPSVLTCRDQTSVGHDVGTNRLEKVRKAANPGFS